MSTTIAIEGLTKTYPAIAPAPGAPKTTTAVDHVSLTINAGELFFLLGPSGCGKTTLLRMIAGFIDPTEGRILFKADSGELDVTFAPPNARNTGMVFQSYALWPHMTVFENVAFGLDVRKVKGDERKRRVMEALEQVQMGHLAQRKPTQLSGGQQQRVALARALVIRPSVLLLDEPLSNLDAKLRLELRGEIRRVCKDSGITTVYVTHDQKEALSMADRVAIMRLGQVVQLGTPRDLYRSPATRFVAEFLGETNLIPGTITRLGDDAIYVETPAGNLRARSALPQGVSKGSQILVSIRPEALNFSAPGTANALAASLTGSTYLGEIAQYDVEWPGTTRLKMSQLNPLGPPPHRPGEQVHVGCQPHDVILLPPADA